jgi:2-dehydro-3-deoxyglucarate aldolase/4-hydroxy-2-oxoheptanedioate aldolase
VSTPAIRTRLAARELVLGTFITDLATPTIGRVAAAGGAEFMVIDQEHTALSLQSVKGIIAAAGGYPITSIVRVPDARYDLIAGALDAGAGGILVPMVEDLEEARNIVAWSKYPPQGVRGAAFYHSDSRDPDGLAATQARLNAELLTLVQIETVKGLDLVDDIAQIEGIDVLWVGQLDLTTSMGIPGDFDAADYRAALTRVGEAARLHGKVAGMLVQTPDEAQVAIDAGFRVLAYSGEVWLFERGLREGIREVRARNPGTGA